MKIRIIAILSLSLVFNLFISYPCYSDISTYTFVTGGGTDKWVYSGTGTQPPSTGPDVSGEVLEPGFYSKISASDNDRSSTTTGAGNPPFHHFKFNITEPTSSIKSIYIEWEGYSFTDSTDDSELYVASTSLSGVWTFMALHSNLSDTVISTTIANTSRFLRVWPSSTTLDFIIQSDLGSTNANIYTDFVKVLVDYDPFYSVWNSAESGDERRGVAWGDYDNDGDMDYLVGNRTQANRLYRNNGNGTFENIWSSAETDATYSVAWGDYDNDGDLDQLVGNYDAPSNNRIYRNDGNNTFNLVWTSTETDATTSVAWGDYDNDGDLDQLVGNAYVPIRVYKNNGDGIFVNTWSAPISEVTYAVAWGDFDNDGDLDFLAGNYGTSLSQPTRVYRNNGDGTFTSIWTSSVYRNNYDVAWGDYDNDGDLDFLLGNVSNQANQVYRNNGNGTFTNVWSSAETDNTGGVAWGDYDNDGDLDQLSGNDGQQNRIYRNDGSDSFTLIWNSKETENTYHIAWGDYDNDGDLDQVAINTTGQTSRVYKSLIAEKYWANTAPGVGAAPGDYTRNYNSSLNQLELRWSNAADSGTGPTPANGLYYLIRIATEPISNNLKKWIVSSSTGAGATPFLGNYPHGFISGTPAAGINLKPPIKDTTYYWQIKSIDAGLRQSANWSDSANSQSIYVPNSPPGKVTGLTGTSLGPVQLSWVAPGADNYSGNVTGGLWQIKYSTTAGANPATAEFTIEKSSNWTQGNTYSEAITGLKPRAAHNFWIRARDEAANNWSVWSDTITATPGSFILYSEPFGADGPSNGGMAFGDFDNDGDPDLVVLGTDGAYNRFNIYRNDSGTFNLHQQPEGSITGYVNGKAVWGDYDKDGDLDLAVNGYDGTNFKFRIYKNNSGTFSLASEPSGTPAPGNGGVDWGDYDNDGDLDIAVNGYDGVGQRFRIYRNDSGTFNLAEELAGSTGPGDGDVAWGDYDNDGELDLAVSGHTGSNYRFWIYRNDAGVFTLANEPAGTVGPGSTGRLAWGDYDNDGDLDIAVNGSNGSNRFRIYRNDAGTFNLASEPAGTTGPGSGGVAWGDYDNDGDLDIVVNGFDDTAQRFRVYKNDSGVFNLADEPAGTTGPGTGSVCWADFDQDGDLDMAVNGWTGSANRFRIYKSLEADYYGSNSQPAVIATGFSSNYNSATNKLELRWDKGTDTAPGTTPQNGLYYSVMVSTNQITSTPSAPFIVSVSTGIGATPFLGNYPHGFSAAAPQPGLNFTPPVENATYYWQVRAIDAGLKAGPWSTTTSTYVPYLPPAAPTGFAGTALSTVSIRWTWIDNATNELGHRVRQSPTFAVMTLEYGGATYYVETGLAPNTSYYRYAEAYRVTGTSSTSSSVIKYTLANPPVNTAITNVYVTSVTFNWSLNNNPSNTNFEIYRSPDNSGFIHISTAMATSYTDTGLSSNTTYYYKIQALNGDGIPTAFNITVSTKTLQGPDTSPPTVGITLPVNAFYNTLGIISGTAQDDVAISTIQVKIQRASDTYEWNGSTFVLAGFYNGVSNYSTPNWSYNIGNIWVIGSTYTIIARAQDTSGNWSTVFATTTFCFIASTAAAPNNAPVLSWTGETNYTSGGVTPVLGSTSTVFIYSVKYTDADNDAPMAGYPKVHIKKSATEISTGPFSMTYVYGSYSSGAIYSYSRTLSSGADYTYYFEAQDSKGVSATGTPTTPVGAPDVSGGKDTTVVVTPGSGGTAVVTRDTGQEMKVELPGGTFTADVTISVSVLEPAAIPESYQPDIKKFNVGLSITLPAYDTPLKDITVTIGYSDAELTGVIDENALKVAYYDGKSKRWVTLTTYSHDTALNKITVMTKNLAPSEIQSAANSLQARAAAGSTTKFALVEAKAAATSLKDAYAYPSLFKYSDGVDIKFANLSSGAKVSVFSISGNFVWESSAQPDGSLTWNGISLDNEKLGTGVYVVYVLARDSRDKKILKIIITK